MPSTDIDGTPITIFSEDDARTIYSALVALSDHMILLPTEQRIAAKIARELDFTPEEDDILCSKSR